MTIFGDKSRFAQEIELAAESGGPWMFGRLRFWCGGLALGDFQVRTSLRDALFQLEGIGRYRLRRESVRFANMDPVQAFRLLDGALYGRCEIDNRVLAEQEEWARHNIVPDLDVFDCCKGFLVETPTRGRLLFSSAPYEAVTETILVPGECDAVFDSATEHLQTIYLAAEP